MNVNRLYVAQIYVTFEKKSISRLETEVLGKYLKNAIVYHDNCGGYVDLISGEKYRLGIADTYPGDMYIYLKNGLIPITEVFDISFKKIDMPKKKILKKLSGAKLLNKKEDDK